MELELVAIKGALMNTFVLDKNMVLMQFSYVHKTLQKSLYFAEIKV